MLRTPFKSHPLRSLTTTTHKESLRTVYQETANIFGSLSGKHGNRAEHLSRIVSDMLGTSARLSIFCFLTESQGYRLSHTTTHCCTANRKAKIRGLSLKSKGAGDPGASFSTMSMQGFYPQAPDFSQERFAAPASWLQCTGATHAHPAERQRWSESLVALYSSFPL